MSSRLKGVTPSSVSSGDKASFAKQLLRTCLEAIHEHTRRYYYSISTETSMPGCLSFLLGITEADLVEIFKICGFYNEKKGIMQWSVFRMWVVASFDKGTMEVTSYKRSEFIKIGTGTHPNKPASQVKDQLLPPSFRMQTTEGQSSKNSLMGLFDKPPGRALFDTPPRTPRTTTTYTTTTTETTAAPATPPPTTTTTTHAAAPSAPVNLSHKFNIPSPDKSRLAMELISEMATPQKAPLMRELVCNMRISKTCRKRANPR